MRWGPEEVFNNPASRAEMMSGAKPLPGLHLKYNSPCIGAGYDFPYTAYSGKWMYYQYIGRPESYQPEPVYVSDWHIGNYPPAGPTGATGVDFPGAGFLSPFLPFQID